MANRLRASGQIQDKDRYISISEAKRQMVAMLTELKNIFIDKSWNIDMYDDDLDFECCYLSDIDKVIEQKIDKIKGDAE